ncbi:NusA antitermination factor [Thalassoporum mexicanum PCC 7367]|uniref:transcription termination factor NusA n=1 Tax=Thalassoporum mexicanum TaxID=3457544 RepID=UPI00029F9495|nr:transcription termination factor NusA [Pseudanabaena sp. PCC 7367]AFY69028.1 NusA antitermination factor [Pseudanabaena sp. PCC 7367]
MALVTLQDLQPMVEAISRERNLPIIAVQNALREALLKGYERFRKTYRSEGVNYDDTYFENFEVELDMEEEGFRVLATKTIVEEVENSDREIGLAEVREVAPEAQAGGTVVVDVTPDQRDFGRMAAIQTKQVLAQKLRDQQRKLIQEEFQDIEGTVLQGRVLRFENSSVVVEVNSGVGQPAEAELPKREQLPSERPYRPGSTIKVYLKRVYEGSRRGPQLMVSRADAGLVVYLFANEVPEIEDEVVRIVAVAREANPPSSSVGPRTKIAVDTLERDVDPVGACIGARGARIQAVVNELRGEKIDVIRWSPDPATYIANSLSPARIHEVRLMNADERQAHVLVPDDQLSLAIGKEGQNVRLAARLTGWKIDIKDASKYDYEAEDQKAAEIAAARAAEIAAIEAQRQAAAEEEARLAAEEEAELEALEAEEQAASPDAEVATEETEEIEESEQAEAIAEGEGLPEPEEVEVPDEAEAIAAEESAENLATEDEANPEAEESEPEDSEEE